MGFLGDILKALTRQAAPTDSGRTSDSSAPVMSAPANPEIQAMIDRSLATLAARPTLPPAEPKPPESLPLSPDFRAFRDAEPSSKPKANGEQSEFRAFRDSSSAAKGSEDDNRSGFGAFQGCGVPFRAFRDARERSNAIEDDPYDIGIEPPRAYHPSHHPHIEEVRARYKQRFEDAMLAPLRAKLYSWKPSDYATRAERRASLEALARQFGLDDPEDDLRFALERLYAEHLRERSRVEELQVVRSHQRDRGYSR